MTREEAIRCLSVHSSTNGSGLCTDKQHYEAKQMAIKALEQEPCEDWYDVPSDEMTIEQARQAVKDLRKKLAECLEQEPKTGHWEWVQYDYNPKLGNWHCSECRCVVVECVDKNEKGCIPLYKYCPQCGTKMIEPKESEAKCKNCEYYRNPDYTRCHKCKAESEDKE